MNYKIIKQLKTKFVENHSLFKTIKGVNFTNSRSRLHLKINKIEEEIDVCVIKNINFSYDLLLGLDAIKKFKLSQDKNLNNFQKINDQELVRYQEEKNNYQQANLNVYIDVSNLKGELQHLN